MSYKFALTWFCTLFVGAIVGNILSARIQRRISRMYPDAYKAMGSPSFFWNASPANGLRFLRFLWFLDKSNLDKETIKLCTTVKTYQIAYLVWFLIPFIVLICLYLA